MRASIKAIIVLIISLVTLGVAGFTVYQTTKTVNVKFYDENNTLILEENVRPGTVPTAPADPIKQSDEKYIYTFAGWSVNVGEVTADTVYVARYTESYKEYVVTFYNGDGSVLLTKKCHYEDTIAAPQDPTLVDADGLYTYTFTGWSKTVQTTVTANADYTAQYNKEAIMVTYQYIDANGNVVTSGEYAAGQKPTPPTTAPEKTDETYEYTFTGWKETTVSGIITFEPEYTKELKNYTIKFVDYDGSEIASKVDYHFGDTVVIPADPTRSNADGYTYTFTGWDKTVAIAVSESVTYTAQYSKTNLYTVTFKDADGTVIKSEVIKHGDPVKAPADPVKAEDMANTYAFNGWDKTVSATCQGEATYTATYKATAKTYTVKFVNFDGTQISETTYKYEETIAAPEATKASDAYNEYTFAGWTGGYTGTCTGDATYTASFNSTAIEYTIKFVDEDGETVIASNTYKYGEAVVAPQDPTKAADNTYTWEFAGWDSEVQANCLVSATYKATYTSTYIDYTVTFVDEDGTTVLQTGTFHYGDTVTAPTATKVADNTYTYAFANWDSEVVAVAGNATYKAVYASTYIDYTITFVDEDGTTVLQTGTFHYGDAVTAPTATKEADNTYTWAFDKWDSEVVAVAGNATYKASYTSTYIEYTVQFVDEDGTTVLQTNTYHYGDEVAAPANPTKNADNTYTYAFSKWDNEVVAVAGNTTYKAEYASTYIDYTVTFIALDGTTLSTATYHYDDELVAPVTTKDADNTYTWEFAGWGSAYTGKCVGNANYKAVFNPTYIDYTIEFVDEDGTTVLQTGTFHYGDAVAAPADPTKAADNTYTWAFSKWDGEVSATCAGNATYKAVYASTYIDYTIEFVDEDGTTVLQTGTFHYGDPVTAPTATKNADETYTWAFANWDIEVSVTCAGNATYKAVYTSTYIDYTVTFYDEDGTTVLQTGTFHYGDPVTAPTATKDADNTYTYAFANWDSEVVAVAGNAEYKASYTSTYIDYTVTFVDEDGVTEISTATYHYGETVVVPVNPTKDADNTYTYAFDKWDSEVVAVAANATYTAVYTSTYIEYTITFIDLDGTTLSSTEYHYGDEIEAPVATKAADNTYTWTFSGWGSEYTGTVSGNAEYQASYAPTYINYTITFVDEDGTTVLQTGATYHYGDTVTAPTATKDADNTYTWAFSKWDSEVVACAGDATYKAVYVPTYIDYTITFYKEDGTTEISTATYHYGETVVVPTAPAKDADETYTWAFSEWDSEVSATCEGNATYKAVYASTYIDYTINFLNDDDSVISTLTLHYGDAITAPTATKASDSVYDYTFDKWDTEVAATVTGNATYKASYTSTYIKCTITFVDYDGTVISESEVTYGETPVAPEASRDADETYTYAFKEWDSEIVAVTEDKTYTATYTATYIDYTVKFENADGTEISSETYHYGDEVVVPTETPVKAADETYTYTFKGWDATVVACAGNVTYTATYTETYIDYTVTFMNNNGVEISSTTYHYGETVVVPADPAKEDLIYTYTFTGWDNEVVACSGDATYTATYTSTYINYTFTFKDYNGSVIETQTYHYFDAITAPADPTRDADNTYTYAFSGWNTTVAIICTGDAEYTATYEPTYIDYTITFYEEDGVTEISSATYHYGETVVVPTAPVKDADETYTYAFANWDSEVVAVAGDATYKAVYEGTYIDYTVTFYDEDGTTVLQSNTYHYGDAVTAPADPTKAADNTYTWAFDKWDSEVVACAGNATYKAVYASTYIEYTVTFYDEDGTTVLQSNTYHYGDAVTAPTATKNADSTYTYAFDKWDSEVSATCEGNAEYKASYTSTYIDYTVQFVDEDGTTVLQSNTYHYGDAVTAPADPTKAADNTYTWSFANWDSEVSATCEGDATYKAVYTSEFINYTITFVDEDGTTEISSATYHYGETVVVPTDPTKTADETYTYAFDSWDSEVVAVVADATYKAVYSSTKIDYEIKFIHQDGTVISTETYNYGDTIVTPADPTKPADVTYTYTFLNWGTDYSETCTGNATYTAVFSVIYINYTIEFVDEDGTTVLQTGTYHYGDAVTAPADPTKAADNTYTWAFAGWDATVVACAGNATYTATYQSTFIEYTVEFVNYDGTVVKSDSYHYGDEVTAPTTNPAKPEDDTYTYEFAGWDATVVACAGNATYTATYNSIYKEYTITFVDEDGSTVLQTGTTYHYGDEVIAPTATKDADETYTWAFANWDSEVVAVAGNATYKAVYTSEFINYTITFVDEDGETVLQSNTYHYGDAVTAPAAPTKDADVTYTWAFDKWDSEVVACAGDATYKATYKYTYIDYTVTFYEEDGTTEISSATYHYGATVVVPTAPVKPSDNTYTYAFSNWDSEVVAVTGNATYKAVYSSTFIDYTVTFYEEDGVTEISTATYHYGETVEVPTAPAKDADETYTYAFSKWDSDVVAVAGNATYKAVYASTFIEYTVTFYDEDGETVLQSNTYHFGATVTAPAPTKTADKTYTYAFAAWNTPVVACAGDAEYTASYSATYIDYTVKFYKDNGAKILFKTDYHYDDEIVFPTAEQVAKDDGLYTYTFVGWDKEDTTVTEDIVFTAVYTYEYKEYTVQFVDYNGTVIKSLTLHYFDEVDAPEDPVRAADAEYTYTFAGWDKTVVNCEGNATYTATYTTTPIGD